MLEPRTLLERLLEAETEADVHRILGDAALLDDDLWLPYGGQPNNAGLFRSQQADARGALVEKIVNSIDAVLMRHAYEYGDIQGGALPKSMFTAAERYFNLLEGKLHNISTAERSRLAAQSVQVVFTGKRGQRPTITIFDQGEGQSPDRFSETFLSLLRNNKRTIPFVQGQFNMGSAGAVPFCGFEHRYQLILSKRHPSAPESDGKWGFTVVRRRRPEENEKTSIYQYLAPHREIPAFVAGALPLRTWMPDAKMEYGSVVRLYEYDIPDKGVAKLDFSSMLNRRLYRLPLPIQVIERRYGQTGPETIAGMETILVEDKSGLIVDGWPQGGDINPEGVGLAHVRLTPFEPDVAKRWLRASEHVLFTVNGQAHSFEGSQFLKRSGRNGPNLVWLAPTLLVEVDCSRFAPWVIEELFMSSRDRMRDNEMRQSLLSSLGEYLRTHPGLRALNEHRRQEDVRHKSRNDPRDAELFSRLSSEITKYLHGNPGWIRGNEPQTAFEGRRFPTYLRWANRGDGEEIEKHCPQNGACVVDLQTDAENEFLTRPDSPGICEVEPADWLVSHTLSDGELRIRLRAPDGVTAGDRLPLVVRLLCDDALETEFRADGWLSVDLPAAPVGGGGGNGRRRRGTAGPRIEPVSKGQPAYESLEFEDHTVAKVEHAADGTIVWVNMDNVSLHLYRRGQPRRAVEINRVYSLAAAAITIATDTAVNADDLNAEAADAVLGIVGRVLAPTIDFVNQNAFDSPEPEDEE